MTYALIMLLHQNNNFHRINNSISSKCSILIPQTSTKNAKFFDCKSKIIYFSFSIIIV